ncbi:MAG: PilZ domain-containing protein [Candidatus Electrothrix sp. AR3]|nr:PilZ domain-containing protein [Candidatus Electrothrix sp. AR3]
MIDLTEKRRQDRMKLKGYMADIAVGHFVFDGIVEDISAEGLRLNDLPTRFIIENKKYCIVVSDNTNSFSCKMQVSPRWKKKNGNYLEMGFNIAEVPSGWETFVQQHAEQKG